MKNNLSWSTVVLLLLLAACSSEKSIESKTETVELKPYPNFQADSAFAFVKKQVDFGPRVPGSPSHAATKAWIQATLESYGWTVQQQNFQTKTYDGLSWDLTNLIASYNPKSTKRILLAAHWDTRRIADKDTLRTSEPIDGANDGASGVAVLMEIARSIASQPLSSEVGVDLVFFDGEDDGEPEFAITRDNSKIWWCHGSQYWSKNKHIPNYVAYYGILVDMVGGKNARFFREGYSRRFASGIISKVWSNASLLGHSTYFIQQDASEILDDHAFVNEWAGIPMIDIIDFSPNVGFGPYHHTHQDGIDGIDRRTLNAVGETILATIYQE